MTIENHREKKNIIKPSIFYGLVLIEVLFIFILNFSHTNQQYIFTHRYLVLANNLLSGSGYSLNGITPEFYPMWGYPLLCMVGVATNSPAIFTLLFQVILVVIGIHIFYKMSSLSKRLIHLFWFIPFIALMSVKWPDAIVAFLLLVYILSFINFLKQHRWIHAIIGGITLGLILNFRSEYIYFPFFVLIFALIFSRDSFKVTVKFSSVSIVCSILLLLPWSFRSIANNSGFRTGASNTGLVLFTTLGQLPHNPWNIAPTDQYGEDIVKAHGASDPYSPQGDSILEKAFVESVASRPISFGEKVGYNFVSIFYRGLYVGEYSRIFMNDALRDSTETRLQQQDGVTNKISYLEELTLSVSLPYLVEKSLQILFIVLFTLMLITVVFQIKRRHKQNEKFLIPILSIICYKFLLVSFVQYEPRHINAIYMFVLILYLTGKPFMKSRSISLARPSL